MKKIIAVLLSTAIMMWTFTGCASLERTKKDWQSEMENGIKREITVFSATGEKIWSFEGKFDVDYSSERILFDDENNKRHIIYFKGGTVVVNEV